MFLFRQESIKQAERERRQKYKKQDDEREVIRSAIRDKVGGEEYSETLKKVSLLITFAQSQLVMVQTTQKFMVSLSLDLDN